MLALYSDQISYKPTAGVANPPHNDCRAGHTAGLNPPPISHGVDPTGAA